VSRVSGYLCCGRAAGAGDGDVTPLSSLSLWIWLMVSTMPFRYL
jgi:hypothetical protein